MVDSDAIHGNLHNQVKILSTISDISIKSLLLTNARTFSVHPPPAVHAPIRGCMARQAPYYTGVSGYPRADPRSRDPVFARAGVVIMTYRNCASKIDDFFQFSRNMAAEGLNGDWVEAEISRQLELISIENDSDGEVGGEESSHQQVSY